MVARRSGKVCQVLRPWFFASILLLAGSQAYAQQDWPRIFSQNYRRDPNYISDETAGHVHKPNNNNPHKKMNNYGFVEEAPTEDRKKQGSLRILVTGDSHIDGIVGTRENFPNVLETMLSQRDPGRTYEVINGGVGFYTFTNYAGFLEKFLFLEPDIYVVVIYLGNDFVGIAEGLAASGELSGARPEDYRAALRNAARSNPGAVHQHLNQVFFFKKYPEVFERVVEVSHSALDGIMAMSAERGIRVIFVLLPTKIMTESAEVSGVKEVSSILGLSPEDLRVFDEKAKASLMDWMNSRKAECLDLTEPMTRDPRELFAKRDHHLNVAGHQALAEWFYDRFGEDLLGWKKSGSLNR